MYPSLESVFNLLEMNATATPAFKKLIDGEHVSGADLLAIAAGARKLGLYEFAHQIETVPPQILRVLAKAADNIERAKLYREALKAFVG